MEIKSTIQNKANFFALYWGQKVLLHPEIGLLKVNEKTMPLVEESCLQLKSLKQIDYGDAIDACEVGYPSAFKNPRIRWSLEKLMNDNDGFWLMSDDSEFDFTISTYYIPIISMTENEEDASEHFSGEAAADFLRKMGYALPYLGIPLENMEEWGWLKLDTVS